jgi:hypothetical protein
LNASVATTVLVMPGLVPGIHVLLSRSPARKPWMAGTSQDKPGHDGEKMIKRQRDAL